MKNIRPRHYWDGKIPVFTGLVSLLLFAFSMSARSESGERLMQPLTGASLAVSSPHQDTRTIKGIVTDETGETVIGASVFVKGTTAGTITDIDGNFSLEVSESTILTVSFIGYIPQDIPVKGQTSLNIVLKENTQALDEVVVVGYGTQKKVNMTGAVAAVKMDEAIGSRTITDVSSGLSGLVPGLTVQQRSGFSGFGGAALQVRGLGSVNNADPLIVVDGMPDVDINSLNMNDIESISVLKDAASSAVYGSRAANGVILVTTKTGKGQSKAKINYTGSYAWSKAADFYPYLDDYSRAMRMQIVGAESGNTSTGFRQASVEQWMAMSMVDPILFPNTDQYDEMFQTGGVMNHTISASGSSDKVNFFVSAGIMDEDGLQIHNDYQRYNIRTNIDYKIRDNITVGVKMDGAWKNITYPRDKGLETASLRYAISGILNKHPETGQYGGAMAYGENSSAGNMVAEYEVYSSEREQQEYNGTLYGIWEIIKGLSVDVSYGLRYHNRFTRTYTTPSNTYNFQTGDVARKMPSVDEINNEIVQGHKTLFQGKINFQREIFPGHDLAVMAAATQEYWFKRELYGRRLDKLYPSLTELNAASTASQTNRGLSEEEGLLSYLGRLNYTLYDRYLFEATFRYDGSSRFVKGHQYGFFPSVAVGWRLSEEPFFDKYKDIFNNVKFRASYGTLGNNSGVRRYEQKNTLKTTNYVYGGSLVKGFSANKMINPLLSWESTSVFNVGLDLGFLNNQLTAEIDYYDRLTTDMIRPSDHSTLLYGYDAPNRNIGEMRNRGVEMNLNWRQSLGDFRYNVNLNASYNTNKLEKWNDRLSRGWIYLDMPYHFVYSYEAYSGLAQSWNDIYNRPYQGGAYIAPGDVMVKDLNGDGRITDLDQKAYENRYRDEPTIQYGLTLAMSYKGFDFSALLQGGLARWDFWTDEFNTVNVPADRFGFQQFHWDDTWNLDNRNASLPRITTGSTGSYNTMETSYYLQNASYLRFKNLQIGYAIPANILNKITIDRARIFVSAENLFTVTGWKGIDPEKPKYDWKNNGNYDLYPLVKTISVGLNIDF